MPTPPNLTPPTGNSRSGSPSNDQPRARIVSGSIRDRMARFENPTAAPLIPTHPFGTAGPAQPSTAARGGLVGNRIPSLDPKTAGLYGGNRKVSENRGLVGNRIPSGTVGSVKTASSTGARSASPSGSVDSSTASAANTFASPNTSRASSPPSSPGHPHDIITSSGLLSATEPDNGGPGAMTPSSTRAEAGEEVSQFSAPSTPVQAPAQTSGHYDLVPPNLKLASGEAITPSAAQLALTRGLSNLSVARSATGAQSLGSSRVSQYDPGSQGSENQETMLKDVSNVSTPHSTPRAERNELEGSVRGEESVRGEGSIADEGDLKETTQAMGGLGIEGVDRDPTPEPPAQAESHKDESIKEGGFVKASEVDGNVVIDDEPESTPAPPHPNDLPDPSQPSKEDAEVDIPINAGEHIDEIAGKKLEEDPNQADDLADLKSGNLSRKKAPHGTHSVDQNPINNIVEAGISMGLDEQVVPTEELKEQGGVAGERIEDVEKPDAVEQPKDKSEDYAANDELEVQTATATNESAAGSSESAQTQHVSEPESASQQTKDSKEEKVSTIQQKDDDLPRDSMPDIIEGKRAAGLRLDDAEGAGAGPLTSGETDKLKDHLNEERRKAAEKEIEKEESQGADPNEGLQTEEDRDEGKSRREQLIEALDQNKNADEDLQEEVDEETRAKARGVTEKITAELRDKEEEGDAEEDVEKKVAADKGEHKETVQADKVTQDAGQANLSKLEKDLEEDKDDETQSNEHKKPIRVQLEPAPIAQPAEDVDEDDTAAKDAIAEPKVESDASKTPAPSFPTPPSEDPDVVDPITPESAQPETIQASEPATPLDTNVIKSFPEVPDEEKPRVEVHVSHSPLNSPMKGVHNDHQPETPLAKLPGTSKSLSTQDLAKDAESGSESGEGRRSMEVEGTPSATKSAKRLSTRRSPKSPLLDDEDPGDFEPGEGYVVVTKGRESR